APAPPADLETPPDPSAGAARPSVPTALRTGPGGAEIRRRVRVVALVVALLIAGALLIAVFGRSGPGGDLDPRSAKPSGARAIAQLLRNRGIGVTFTDDPTVAVSPAAGTSAAAAARTIVLPRPGRLTEPEVNRLAAAAAHGAHLVLIDPSDEVLSALGAGMHTGPTVDVRDRPAGCLAPEATTAGSAWMGGSTFDGTGVSADCYPAGGLPTLVLATVTSSGRATPDGRLAVVGSGTFLTNAKLASSGDAALALELLAARPSVLWLMPTGGRAGALDGGGTGLLGLVSAGVLAAFAQLGVAVLVLAAWRGRRLGPPVPEPLPVVVRAAETVEGRARLYRAAHAGPAAAEALTEAARSRLTRALGVPTTADGTTPDPAALVGAVAAATGRPPNEIGTLLYGSGSAGRAGPARRRDRPVDDALVQLARDLDDLEREARKA
ncbi:MAG: DUF4350 domain-containing protein, partial [Frankia sp.]